MKRLLICAWLLLLTTGALAQATGLRICETDGSPCRNGIKEIYVSPGTLTLSGQKATIAIGGGGGSPGGSSGVFQINSGGSFGGATGVSYAASGAPTVSITGQSTSQLTGYFLGPNGSSNAITAIQLGTGGSSGNFVEYRNAAGTALSVVDSIGAMGLGITSSFGGRLHVVAGGSGNAGRFDGAALSTNTVLVARQGGSSTGNLFETQGSGGTVQVAIANGGAITQTSASATAFESGPNGGTNPVFRLVNDTASSATGLSITGRAAGNGVTLTALSSGTNEAISIVSKGTGNVALSNSAVSLTLNTSQSQYVGAPLAFASNVRVTSGTNLSFSNGTDYGRGLIGITGGVRVNQGESSSTGQGNFLITSSTGSVGTSGVGVLVMQNGTAPSSRPADEFQFYAADYAAGDSRANILSENNATPVTIGNHSVLTGYQHLTKTADYTVVTADSNAFFDNVGAGAGVTFTLPTPTASPSLKYTFCRVANQTMTVDIGGSVTIRSGASVTTSGGNVTLDAVGSCITIHSISSTEWYAPASVGTLTFN